MAKQQSTSAENAIEEDKIALDAERVTIEEAKVQGDLRLRRRELELKKEELLLKRREQDRSIWINPLNVGVLVAILGFFSSLAIKGCDDSANRELEKIRASNAKTLEESKLNSNLILEAIKTGDKEKAADNLAFLIETDLIKDPSGAITAHLAAKKKLPVLPATSHIMPTYPPTPSISGEINEDKTHLTFSSTVVQNGPSSWEHSFVVTNLGKDPVKFRGPDSISGFVEAGKTIESKIVSSIPWKAGEVTLHYGAKSRKIPVYVPTR